MYRVALIFEINNKHLTFWCSPPNYDVCSLGIKKVEQINYVKNLLNLTIMACNKCNASLKYRLGPQAPTHYIWRKAYIALPKDMIKSYRFTHCPCVRM